MEEQDTPPVRKSARITHHEIKAMKVVTAKEPPALIKFFNKFKTMLSDTVSSILGIFAPKHVSSCELNGHVFPKGAWEGEFPRCSHCGQELRSTDELGTR
ncbi:MAG: hypothetical protein JSS86_16800 [Cyanobacteria bacterium SZAS LIN-2]|nr:hypothetical protein [Cyanobacteria bacterium SZAS LIN-2]